MKSIHNLLTKTKNYYGNMLLMKKYMFAFLFLVAIPTIILSISYFVNINNSLYAEYKTNQEKMMQSTFFTVDESFRTLEQINKYFQSSTVLINYLQGKYEKDADVIHYYNNDIYNLFSYVQLTNDFISDIELYSFNDDILIIPPCIKSFEEFKNKKIIYQITPQKGMWITHFNGDKKSIIYLMKFYSENYHQELGVLRIEVDFRKILSLINKDTYNYIRVETPQGDYVFDGYNLHGINDNEKYDLNIINHTKVIVNTYKFPDEMGRLEIISNININTTYYQWELIKVSAFIVVLCAILGTFYFITYNIIVKRLKNFKKHITEIKDERIIPFKHIGSMDEVGFLMVSFNQLAERINNLIDKVYKEEILKKEAMYYALEAQINPHFLYNTLESIRMIAEENCDFDVSDQLYQLGSILRYTLSKNQDFTVIADEINYTEQYLNLFENRNKSNFSYKIHHHIDDDQVVIPKYIVQPLIENTIKHGFADKTTKCEIIIDMHENKEFIFIRVSDNGKGMTNENINTLNMQLKNSIPGEVLKFASGIGLFNVNDRIRFYCGNDTGLTLYSNKNEGLSVVAKLRKRGKQLQSLQSLKST